MNDGTHRYTVLVNGAGQYALHPEGAEEPSGWLAAGFGGTEEECVAHVDRCWTDTRPAHLRRPAGAGHA
ncbi:MbtH family protein [Planomonospora corallina]|uniref:MbtH family protein n=1 Tax=Planomonospora corallina TaxID=1806052 RepID=A0ABV8IBT6_9ACTN